MPFFHSRRFLTTELTAIHHDLTVITERLTHMATQQDIDALSTQLAGVQTTIQTEADTLTTADTAIQAEIAALQTANPTLDLTALTAETAKITTSAASLKAAADAVAAIPVPPAAPPTA